MTKNEFEQLKKLVEVKLAFDETNLQGKLSEIALMYDTFLKIFIRENKILEELKLRKDIRYGELFKYLKYDSDIRWESKYEIESQMTSDNKYQTILFQINEQQEIVTYLSQCLENVKTLSYSIKNYIDWRKFLEAER